MVADQYRYQLQFRYKSGAQTQFWVGMAVLMAGLCFAFSAVSPWLGVGLFLTGLIFVQLVMAFRGQVPLLQLMLLYQLTVFFLASVPLHFYPPRFDWLNIKSADYPAYLAYAVPCCIAVYLGVLLATRRMRPIPYSSESANENLPPWARYAISFVAIGIVFSFVSATIPQMSGLSFVILLFSALRWVGVFTLVLTGYKWWPFYMVVVMALEVWLALGQTVFIDLILWGACTFLIVAYRYRWRRTAAVLLLAATTLMLLLQSVKGPYRKAFAFSPGLSPSTIFVNVLTEQMSDLTTLVNLVELSDTLVRFNQGWVVNSVMQQVPAVEPHAYGETIADGLVAVLVPRIFAPNKATAGGRDLFLKYTGLGLTEGTSWAISIPSEMYVNFGLYGGIAGMFIYGLGMGWLFRRLARYAAQNPVWWAWGPFLGFWAIKGDEDLMNVLNWISKALLVMLFTVWFTALWSGQRKKAQPPA